MKRMLVMVLALMCCAALSADELSITMPNDHEIVIVNESGCNLDVFILGTKAEGTRVPPGYALIVDTDAARTKTIHFRIVGYRRDGGLAGTVERIYELERDDMTNTKWPPWKILPDDL